MFNYKFSVYYFSLHLLPTLIFSLKLTGHLTTFLRVEEINRPLRLICSYSMVNSIQSNRFYFVKLLRFTTSWVGGQCPPLLGPL